MHVFCYKHTGSPNRTASPSAKMHPHNRSTVLFQARYSCMPLSVTSSRPFQSVQFSTSHSMILISFSKSLISLVIYSSLNSSIASFAFFHWLSDIIERFAFLKSFAEPGNGAIRIIIPVAVTPLVKTNVIIRITAAGASSAGRSAA